MPITPLRGHFSTPRYTRNWREVINLTLLLCTTRTKIEHLPDRGANRLRKALDKSGEDFVWDRFLAAIDAGDVALDITRLEELRLVCRTGISYGKKRRALSANLPRAKGVS